MAPGTYRKEVVVQHNGISEAGVNAAGSRSSYAEQQQQPPNNSSTMPLYVPREEELYATPTLHSTF